MTILVPYEIAEKDKPSEKYTMYLGNAIEWITSYHRNHYEKFPGRAINFYSTISDLFDKSVHDCVMLREEGAIDEGIFTIQSKLYKKDECVEVNIMMHV